MKKSYVYLLTTFMLWGSLYVVSQFVLGKIPTFTVAMFRYLIAFIALSLISLKSEKEKIEKSDYKYFFIMGGIPMVLEKVKAILAEQFDVEEDKVTADTDLQEDLGADSLDVVDLLMSIEDEFGVEVPDDEIENIKTVGSLVSYIEANA